MIFVKRIQVQSLQRYMQVYITHLPSQ